MFEWIRSSTSAYPMLEVVHIVGIALLLGSLAVFEWRALGAVKAVAIEPLSRLALPLTLTGFALAAASGLLMFASQPAELLGNQAFMLKMVLVLAAGLNAALFHLRGSLARLDALAKAQTVVSMGLWIAVIACGRWIAYR